MLTLDAGVLVADAAAEATRCRRDAAAMKVKRDTILYSPYHTLLSHYTSPSDCPALSPAQQVSLIVAAAVGAVGHRRAATPTMLTVRLSTFCLLTIPTFYTYLLYLLTILTTLNGLNAVIVRMTVVAHITPAGVFVTDAVAKPMGCRRAKAEM